MTRQLHITTIQYVSVEQRREREKLHFPSKITQVKNTFIQEVQWQAVREVLTPIKAGHPLQLEQ